jgi:hypothetical protein
MDTTKQIMQPDGTMRCSCGSTQFKAQISTGRKVAFGFASMLGSADEVRCLVCGRKYAVMREYAPVVAGPRSPQNDWTRGQVPPRPDTL